MKENLEIAKQKIVSTLWEIPIGTDVWMIFPFLHKTKPLLVTRGEIISNNGTYLMQQIHIDIHDRDGMENTPLNKGGLTNKIFYNSAFASEKCYLTEEAAQDAYDVQIEKEAEYNTKLRQMYKKVAETYIFEKGFNLKGNDLNNYLEGFVDSAMYLRGYKSLLDIHPSVSGVEKMKSFDDIKFGFE